MLKELERDLQDEGGLWKLRGFIDVARKVYALTSDTKVVSKALELTVLPAVVRFAENAGYRVIVAPEQNFYPDQTLLREQPSEKIAIDLKSTYRLPGDPARISGFTLGAFTGYFRDRNRAKNILYPYREYAAHFVLGIIYTRVDVPALPGIFALGELADIVPPIRDIEFIFQPKWRIASDQPGSGNTKNIGSVKRIDDLRSGLGPFARLGDEGPLVFDRYWQEYLTIDMARQVELPRPLFRNLRDYLRHVNRPDLLARLGGDSVVE
ncbi:MAG: restriction endonuclease [Chloroflexi bacterium]|nr:restriction endonuclease [Chloroflexota bacterium]